MNRTLLTLLGASALAVGAMAFVPGQAQAFALTCPTGITGLVTNTTACQYASEFYNNDQPDSGPTAPVNIEQFFSQTNWERFAKDDPPLGGVESGSWSFDASTWSQYSNIMLIFNDGNDTTLVGYLVKPTETNGTWISPFQNPPFTGLGLDQIKDVSHISYYGTPIFEPLTILGSGIALGFGAFMKYKMGKETVKG